MSWVRAAGRVEFAGKSMLGRRVAGHRLALFALDDGFYATNDSCPHLGALLSYGCVVEGSHVECPMHHALFDIRTGASDGSVTERNVRTFAVKVEGDDVYVDLPEAETSTP